MADKTEGGNASVNELPIDIHYNKLLEWLIDRRHCDSKWQSSSMVTREKINSAIQDMPAVDEITQLLSGTYINYFHCLKIVELLKVSESATRNIFGQYSSQRIKDWYEIVKLYEAGNVFLAEVAHTLVRNVNYEIPSLKRQIGKCQQTVRDCTRKEGEYVSNSAVFKRKFQTTCQNMGIKGEDIKSELVNLLEDLPALYTSTTNYVKELNPVMNYYRAFSQFVRPSSEDVLETTPILFHVLEHGNTTVYEHRTGKPLPEEYVKKLQSSSHKSNEMIGDNDGIDFGEDSTGIDFGDTIEGIDFGDTNEGIDFGGTSEGIDFGDEGGNIDFGDGSENTGIDFGGGTITSDLSNDLQRDQIISQQDAETILENTQMRNKFIDELLELQSFLKQRLFEMENDEDILSANKFQSAPHILQLQTYQTVNEMLSSVTSVLESLTSTKIQNLFLIKNSPRYVDRLADSLQQKLKLSEKMLQLCKCTQERRISAAQTQKDLEPKLEVIVEKTKELQRQISEEISKKYNNRPVNIMGEINSI